MRARSLSFPASLSWIPGVLQQQANKAWREKENAFKTNCRQFQGRRKKEERPTDGRSSGSRASAPSSSDREPVKKKGSKSWSTPVCDCLEKESKTVILSDNSNEPELRARSDKATTTRCRKQKLLRLRQRCTGSAVVHGQPFHGVTCNLTGPRNIVAEISPRVVRPPCTCIDQFSKYLGSRAFARARGKSSARNLKAARGLYFSYAFSSELARKSQRLSFVFRCCSSGGGEDD